MAGLCEGGNEPPGDNAGEMSQGSSTESYPAYAHVGLRENPGKNLNQATCPDRESNPGHLVSRPDALTVTPQGNEESKKKFKEHVETAGKECYEKHNPTDEKSEQEMPESLKLVEEMTQGINEAPSTPVTERVKQKWKSILCKNNGHGALCPNINSKLVGIESPENEGLSLRDCNDVRFFRFAPIKSCDVERIFSQYKLCLVDN
ncbi:hypothetical protein ANN_02790 [Periplaneta americana]|uniref:Uncharacterized protein n=1 Tax=Periplaneta americana TaxID=6978 RepID=A0ABQ8TYE8_PERAM|nr:hypothetical protein ANN_02790 [Periplaneta americana]